MALELDYDRSLHETEHLSGPFEVTSEQVRAFSRGIGETNPIHTNPASALAQGYRGLVAPPTFCTILVHRVALPDINLKFGRTQVNAGQRVRSRAPVVAGDVLSASSHLKEVYAKTGRTGTMVFVVWETTFRNQKGTVVAEVQESFARRD